MAKDNKARRRFNSCRTRIAPYQLPCCRSKGMEDESWKKRCPRCTEKKDWEAATCSVCMEYPHNAVLLLCSSYNKGCRPYMCATSCRYSNCLDQYKKAYTKDTATQDTQLREDLMENPSFSSEIVCSGVKMEASKLLCPLCRGQVKGWTVLEPARKYFNKKKRTCMHDSCSFVGTYKELRKHVRAEHPRARPREVDPLLAEKWKKLEHERELNDVLTTIRSSIPGAIVMGDYVIEPNHRGFLRNDVVHRHSYGRGYQSWDEWDVEDESDEEDLGFSRAGSVAAYAHSIFHIAHRHNRLQLGGSRRRRRYRAGAGNRSQ